MRSVTLAVLALLAAGTPAIADDASDLAAAKAAIAAAKLSPESDLAMWCGAAMTLVSAATKDTDAGKSSAADASATAFFAKAADSLKADGVKPEDFGALSTDYMTVANAELVAQSEPPSHNTDDCVAN